jgi:hypothetical protein
MQLMLLTLIMSLSHLRVALWAPSTTSDAATRIHPAVYEAQVRIVQVNSLLDDTLRV